MPKRVPITVTDELLRRVSAKTLIRGEDECHPYFGANQKGYGKIWVGPKQVIASRVILANKLGRDLAEGMDALHACDNPPCLNPKHLYEGTQADNNADKVRKGRHLGVRTDVRREKFCADDVREIRQEIKAGKPLRAIARERGVYHRAIQCIALGLTWKHVD